MIINLAWIGEEGRSFCESEPVSILELEDDNSVRFTGEIDCNFFAQMVSGELIVTGTWQVNAELECTRCVGFFSTSLKNSSFLRHYSVSEGMDRVDMTEDIRESVLLMLPAFPLCGSACMGLCPQCGKNLNTGDCVCEQVDVDNTWDALSGLNVNL